VGWLAGSFSQVRDRSATAPPRYQKQFYQSHHALAYASKVQEGFLKVSGVFPALTQVLSCDAFSDGATASPPK
jgi:hypothetical protein